METRIILLIVGIFIVGIVVGLLVDRFVLVGEVVREVIEGYTYTTAICNSGNECIDVLVECEGGGVKSLEPVSSLMEFGEEWVDPREEGREFCG